ncbi:hypothetical protein C7967_11532 [Thalassospira sp. 11-3]|nr:hypothetical protein C7967_11532 [Thalassospira sp. 11-3]
MSKKAELIKKDVVLIIFKDDKIKIRHFNECRFFRGTHSIIIDNWTYYCKNESYYAALNYCFIIDKNKKKQALDETFNLRKNKFESDLLVLKKNIESINQKIELENKLKHNLFL